MQKYTFPFISILLANFSFWSLAQKESSPQFKVLLFADSNLKQTDTQITKRFSSALSASLADVRMRVISPDSITQKISPTKGNESSGSSYRQLTQNNKITLAKQLGAHAILSANLNTFTSTRAEIPKFDRTVVTLRLSANYKFIATDNASAFAGDRIQVEKKIPITSQVGLSFSEDAILSELVEETAALISDKILASDILEKEVTSKFIRNSNMPLENPATKLDPQQKLISATIIARLKGINLPEIIKDADGTISLSGNNLEVSPGDAEVHINGILVGSCSEKNPLKIPEGICRLQIKRPGFVMEEKLINAYEGITLSFNLEPTNKEYQLWREQLKFLQEIKTGETFNENQKRLAEGMFEFLKNSKYEVPEINLNKSLFQ